MWLPLPQKNTTSNQYLLLRNDNIPSVRVQEITWSNRRVRHDAVKDSFSTCARIRINGQVHIRHSHGRRESRRSDKKTLVLAGQLPSEEFIFSQRLSDLQNLTLMGSGRQILGCGHIPITYFLNGGLNAIYGGWIYPVRLRCVLKYCRVNCTQGGCDFIPEVHNLRIYSSSMRHTQSRQILGWAERAAAVALQPKYTTGSPATSCTCDSDVIEDKHTAVVLSAQTNKVFSHMYG